MATDEERAQELYDQLKPEAQKAYVEHISERTPPELQDEVRELAMADLAPEPAPEPDPTQVTLTNGDSVVVKDSVGAAVPGSPGTANVANATLSGITLGSVAQRQTAPRR